MARVYLHVGMPKCGSSSIQAYLSSKYFYESFYKTVHYLSIKSNGHVVSGNELVKQARMSPHGYSSSCDAKVINSFSQSTQQEILRSINNRLDKGYDVILSNEGWGPRPQEFNENHPILSKLKAPITVVAYVRPQIEWLNSAWWQWGAWSDVSVQRWMDVNKNKALWGSLVEQWAEKNWIDCVIPRLICGDVVSDFMSILGFSDVVSINTNKSLPGSLLRFFQNHRRYRKGPHDSAIEFILSRRMRFPPGKTPWVIELKAARELISYFSKDNEKLIAYLEDNHKEFMRADHKWWSIKPFESRKLESAQPVRLSQIDSDDLLCALLDAVLEMDKELRNLQR